MLRTYPLDPADASQIEAFCGLTALLHGDEPGFIPPLRGPLLRDAAGQAAFNRYGRQQGFLAERDGAPVGRIAGFLNPRLRDADGAPLGQAGLFECRDDPEAARALLDAACGWLRAEGARQVVAPMNGGAHRSHRLLVEGFERAPFLFEPRNPPYYPRLLEAAGLQPVQTWESFDTDRDGLGRICEELARAGRSVRGGYRVEPGAPQDLDATIARLLPLLDRVWAGHPGYAPLDEIDLREGFAGLLALMTERHLAFLIDAEGADAGLCFFYPDYAAEARSLGGDETGWGRWLADGRRPRRIVAHTVAVLPEARRTGAAYPLLGACFERALEDGYEEVVLALVVESFGFFRRFLSATRRYALYGRAL